MISLLPSTQDGYLPYFLLYASTAAIIHSILTYIAPIPSLKQFSGPSAPEKTALLAHVYGLKNVYTSLIRFYAAYYISNAPVYDLATATFFGVLWLYLTEFCWFRTVRFTEAVFPFLTSGLGAFWMLSARPGSKTSLGRRPLTPFILAVYEPIILFFSWYITRIYIILFTSLSGYTFIFGDNTALTRCKSASPSAQC
ncbi:Erg28 like protein-domain-containing protein [Aspergillus californicus]